VTPQHPVVIQEGRGPCRALVYLLHVGDSKPSQRYPLGTFDAIRDACGPDPCVVVRGDDGTVGALPVADAANKAVRRDVAEEFEVSRIVVGGWSAGVRGIRRFLTSDGMRRGAAHLWQAWAAERLAGVVACDGLHAPWATRRSPVSQSVEEADAGRGAPFPLPLGPSEVFRAYVERARRGDFAFVLTHCMQDYMEAATAKPRYLSTHAVARELTGLDCRPDPPDHVTVYADGRLRVYSYPGPRVDYDGHVRQLREALPLGLRTMREWGALRP
jgi:hypothetical protein